MLKNEGLLASLWSSPQTPWKMMGKPWGWRMFVSALPVPQGSPWVSPSCAPHFFGKFLPGTIQIPDVKPVALAHLQLIVIEELIGDPEYGLVGPGRGRTVPRVGAMWVQNPLRHPAPRTAGAHPSPAPAEALRGSRGPRDPGVPRSPIPAWLNPLLHHPCSHL